MSSTMERTSAGNGDVAEISNLDRSVLVISMNRDDLGKSCSKS